MSELPTIVGAPLTHRIIPGAALEAWAGEGRFVSLRSNAAQLTGRRIGRLLVLGPIERVKFPSGTSGIRWLCLCDCGNLSTPLSAALRQMSATSCGCYKIDATSLRRTKHGHSRSPEYNSWQSMRRRCYNWNDVRYADYGGRGIKVCERWQNDFGAFLADLGERPTPHHSLERRNVNGDYDPVNCAWATSFEQANNRRNSFWIEAFGRRLTAAQWARETQIPASRIRDRIRDKGWEPERALSTPLRQSRH